MKTHCVSVCRQVQGRVTVSLCTLGNKVQGHRVQLCLVHCGTLGNVSHQCKYSKHVLGCTHTICTAANTDFFTHWLAWPGTAWHAHGQLGITPALAFPSFGASVLPFSLTEASAHTWSDQKTVSSFGLGKHMRGHCPLKRERGVLNQ